MQRFIKIFSVAIVLFATLPFSASADTTPVPIHLTVITSDATLFDGDISVNECFDTETGTTTSVNALCAVQQAASSNGWTTDLIWYSFGPFLNGINSYTSDFANGKSWGYYIDGASGMTSISAHTLHSGEKLLFTYAISPLRIVVASSSPKVGTTTILQAQYYDSANTYDWASATETVFVVDGIATTSDITGLLRYTPTSNTLVSIVAQKAGFVASDIITLSPYTVPSTRVHLRIETNNQTLYSADINVEACADNQAGTSFSINGLCAIEQAAAEKGIPVGLVWYSFGPFVDSIGNYASDNTNYIYWGYYIDRTTADVGIAAHYPTPGEELLLTYNVDPLRITTTTNSPTVGTPIVLSGQYFDSTMYAWATATAATFTVNGIATSSDENGELTLTPTDTNPITVTLSRAGLITTRELILTPVAESIQTSSGGSATPDAVHTIDIGKALAFLRSAATADGSYGAALYTDWVAIGLSGVSGADDIRAKLALYMKANTNPGSLLTDLERRAMALEALGIDPSTGTSRDYMKEMLTQFDGTQWGNKGEINDDIFALLPLTHAGYSASDDIVGKTVAGIVAAQSSTGSWGSIDLTAAAIEALEPLSPLPGVTDAITKAKIYLHNSQGSDGGFGSSFATSWALQAISAMPGENIVTNWTKNGKTPQDYLWLLQQSDGALESNSFDQNSRVWATAYAIPAASGKDWNALLGTYPKSGAAPVAVFGSASGVVGEVLGTTTLATTTTTATSATSTVATSTQALILFPVMTISSTSSTTLTTSTPTKKEVRQPKKVTPKKVIAPALPDVISSVSVSSTTEMDATKTSWTDVMTRPFVRLFKSIRSWFN